jgi:hypothetical protein
MKVVAHHRPLRETGWVVDADSRSVEHKVFGGVGKLCSPRTNTAVFVDRKLGCIIRCCGVYQKFLI